MSRILCVIDGMTDPGFSVANFPNLSSLPFTGKIDTLRGGKAESLNCILNLLGVEQPSKNLRGYVEALAEGIAVEPDDLILRGSWFSVDESGFCGGPVAGEREIVIPEETYRYHFIEQYKALLVFPGMASYVDQITTHPPYGCGGVKAATHRPEGCPIVEQCFDTWLGTDRCLIPWGESAYSAMPAFPIRSAVISGTSVVQGIARLLKMDYLPVEGATGDTDTDLSAKVMTALKAAGEYPFVLLHINGADEASHRCDPLEKIEFLKKVDALVISPLIQSDHEIVFVGDHGADPDTGLHIGESQPYFTNQKDFSWVHGLEEER